MTINGKLRVGLEAIVIESILGNILEERNGNMSYQSREQYGRCDFKEILWALTGLPTRLSDLLHIKVQSE